jgi:fluoride ion exporter CrcB/FEX/DNA-binding MarR family transcriptional regulator
MQEQITLPLPTYIMIVIAIIVLSGILGGIANFYVIEASKKSTDKKSIWGYIVLGIVAAFVVPLFLNMISSNLLEIGQSNHLALFVFCGFCLVAAVFSKSFLENMYGKIMQQVNKVQDEVKELKEQESEPELTDSVITESKQQDSELSENERKVLFAFGVGKYSYRSFSGIKNETNLDRSIVQASLDSLVSKALLSQTFGKDNQHLWYLTILGKRLLGLAKK